MSGWRVGVEEELPAEFLQLLYDQRIKYESDQEDNVSEDFGEESEGDEELGDIGDEDRNLSPEAPPNIPITSPEHRGSLSDRDGDLSSPEAPPYSPLTSPERPESPEMEPASEFDRSRSPINFYTSESDNVVLHMSDGEREQVEEDTFLAPDTHALYASQTEQERDRDVRNRSVNVRRGGRRGVRGVRGQSGRGRGHPNRGRTRGQQWEVGHPLNEIWMNDQDVPPELVGLAMDVLRRRQRRTEGTARIECDDERENEESSESENDDEFRDASDHDFEWYSMESFLAREESFRPERTGSVRVFNSAYDAFRAYWDDDILSLIVTETNLYATKISSQAFQSSWYATNTHEILCLFSFWMMLGIVRMPTIHSCFSLDPLLKTEIFRRIFTRLRYKNLTTALHFIDVESNPSTDRLLRLRPILTHLNSKFQSNYVLSKNICIDESLTLWKGRLDFKQYNRNKASKYGIKTFELCESTTGYLWSFIVYTGKQSATDIEQEPGVSKSTAVVKKLIGPLLNKGYRLFMDNWYNSPLLARFLKRNGTDCVGTLRSSRRDVPNLINKAPLKRGEYIARHSGDVSVLSWQDKNRVTMISTCHGSSTALPTVSSKIKSLPVPFKPQVVLDYNKFMGGVDLKDQMLQPYLLERKRGIKWYMKLFKRLLNISILNSRILLQSSTHKHDHLAFRLDLVNSILTHHLLHCPKSRNRNSISRATHDDPSRYTTFTHWPVLIQSEETGASESPNDKIRKRCVVCLKTGKKNIKTLYLCTICKVPLCILCFKPYHTPS